MSEFNGVSGFGAFSANAGTGAGRSAGGADQSDLRSWYEAMGKAWGSALDDQAGRITELSDSITGGEDTPSQMTLLTAESMRMQFMSNNASTSMSSVGQALETLARKG